MKLSRRARRGIAIFSQMQHPKYRVPRLTPQEKADRAAKRLERMTPNKEKLNG